MTAMPHKVNESHNHGGDALEEHTRFDEHHVRYVGRPPHGPRKGLTFGYLGPPFKAAKIT